MEVPVEELKGKIIVEIINNDNKELIFILNDGTKYKMFHDQQCSEDVRLLDINGDLDDLLHSSILIAEKVSSDGIQKEYDKIASNCNYYSYTWTFYRFATIEGYVVLRWFGTSNGHYSEAVNFWKANENGEFINEWWNEI